jgi:hypothetical protein
MTSIRTLKNALYLSVAYGGVNKDSVVVFFRPDHAKCLFRYRYILIHKYNTVVPSDALRRLMKYCDDELVNALIHTFVRTHNTLKLSLIISRSD